MKLNTADLAILAAAAFVGFMVLRQSKANASVGTTVRPAVPIGAGTGAGTWNTNEINGLW
jgi:hypothetical protein